MGITNVVRQCLLVEDVGLFCPGRVVGRGTG